MTEGMFYLMMHSTHFIYGYMASDSVNEYKWCQYYLGFVKSVTTVTILFWFCYNCYNSDNTILVLLKVLQQ